MSLLVPWLVFPLVLGLLSAGCGLLIEAAAGRRLPEGLLLPVGFALVVTAALFPPLLGGGVTPLATPLVLVLAAAGLVLGLPFRVERARAAWTAFAAAGTYAAYAAPTVLSGRATFDGYIKLDDTATYLAMLDRFMAHGYNTSGLAPSTYEATLNTTLAYGYPMGSLVPLGIGHALLGTDSAWLWQPYLTVLAALLALALYALVAQLVRPRAARAVVAIVAAEAALLYGYALWGGVKELAAAALLVVLSALLPTLFREPSLRTALPPAVAVAALVGVLSLAGAAWLAPLCVVALVVAAAQGDLRHTLRTALGGVAAAAVLAAPSLSAASRWLQHTGTFTKSDELANLTRPLKNIQVAGIWPVGDFRATPGQLAAVHVLIALVAVAALAGLGLALRRRAWGPVLYLGGALGGAGIFVLFASPWIGGKALATASPALLALALAASWSGIERRGAGAAAAALAGAAIVGGVLWSNVLAYRDVWLAPNARLSELETIGKRFAGQGPTLMTEYEPYGARHFLRGLDAEGASELRPDAVPLASGRLLQTGDSADVDEFALSTLVHFRTLVLRRSPAASRPPSLYRLVWQGRSYQVWQRPEDGGGAGIVQHLALGDRYHAASTPSCSRVLAVARAAGPGGMVVTVKRPRNEAIGPTGGSVTLGAYGERSDTRYLVRPQAWREQFRLPAAGIVDVGVDGTVQGDLAVAVDGRRVGSVRSELNWPNQYQQVASVRLTAGTHTVELEYLGSSSLPGTGGFPAFGTGPLIIGVDSRPTVTEVAPADARSLCGRSLDWLEAVSG